MKRWLGAAVVLLTMIAAPLYFRSSLTPSLGLSDAPAAPPASAPADSSVALPQPRAVSIPTEKSAPTEVSLVDEADKLLEQEDEAGALTLLEKHLAKNPDDVEAWLRVGFITAHDQTQWPKAEKALSKVLEESPSDGMALSELLMVYNAQGKYEQGNKLFDELLVRGADPGLISVEKGNFLLAQGRPEEAAEAFLKASGDTIHSEDAIYGIAQAKAFQGDARGATDAFRQFVDTMEQRVREESPNRSPTGELSPNEESLIEGKLSLAASLITGGDSKSAEDILRSVEARQPDHPELPLLRKWALSPPPPPM